VVVNQRACRFTVLTDTGFVSRIRFCAVEVAHMAILLPVASGRYATVTFPPQRSSLPI